jgi:23S rRNA (cytosine1962-C5)-methyltransferase
MSSKLPPNVARLSAKGVRWLATGHPWVFDGDVSASNVHGSDSESGIQELVRVEAPDAKVLGYASWSPRSRIRLRMWTRGEEHPPLGELIARRIEAALRLRQPLESRCDAMRLLASEADGLPGLVVDRYADVLVAQVTSPLLEAHESLWVQPLIERLAPRMLLARNDVRVRRLEGLPEELRVLHGERVEELLVRESAGEGRRDIVQRVEPFAGQKTGLFLDQRPARVRVQELAAAGGAWLDVCSYQGGFSLAALAGGADAVLALDVSGRALEAAEDNARRNGFEALETRRGDAFELLAELAREGRRFRGIIVDPPAFAKSARELAAARRAYLKLNRLAFALLEDGGHCLSCSCSHHMRPGDFAEMLAEAAASSGRSLRDRGRLAPALDHPVLLGFPEGEYLKVHELEETELPFWR